jgi:twitching motility protein PilU
VQEYDLRVSVIPMLAGEGVVLRILSKSAVLLELGDLGMPSSVLDTWDHLIRKPHGILLVTGPTGSGKTTTLATMLDYINRNFDRHIISIEDPIEYIHDHKSCIITQREVGLDTESYEVALKNTLRQAPDVILIGEIRTRETMEHAISFAETGHLCLSTLHANNANQALDRIIHFFPEDARDQIFMDLSLNLKAIVAQQLIPKADGAGRRAAIEVMLNTPLAAELIRKGEIHKLKELMKRSTELGMITFDQHLYQLYEEGVISHDNALAYADSANDVRLMIKLGASRASDALVDGLEGVTLMDGK